MSLNKMLNPDVYQLRASARQQVENGAVTVGYSADREKVLALLNQALATELVCMLRYRCHYFITSGVYAKIVADEFLEHANDELAHADQFAERIVQLGGHPDFSPLTLVNRSHSEYIEGHSVAEMIKENLIAERIAIESYRGIIKYLGEDDPTTRRIFEEVLAKEEEHAEEMADFLESFIPDGKTAK